LTITSYAITSKSLAKKSVLLAHTCKPVVKKKKKKKKEEYAWAFCDKNLASRGIIKNISRCRGGCARAEKGICIRFQVLLFMPVIFVVFYIFIGLVKCSVDLNISCNACKLTRISRIKKKNIQD
jgi:hypothetical protein